jgi:hypothetical protein
MGFNSAFKGLNTYIRKKFAIIWVVKYTAGVTCTAFKPVHTTGCGPPQPSTSPCQNTYHIHMIFSDIHNLIFSQILRQDFTTIK